MKHLLLFALMVLSLESAFAQLSCRPGEIERDTTLNEEQKRAHIKRCNEAMNAEARKVVKAVGIDERDCIEQARYRADGEARDVIRTCNDRAQGLVSCEISSKRIVQHSGYISSVHGVGRFDERKTDEATCRRHSVADAESDALSSCRAEYGVFCDITSRGVVDSYETKRRRRYVIMGPKELYHICRASARAEPSSRYRVQCAVEIIASARR